MADIATVMDSIEMDLFETAIGRGKGLIEVSTLGHHGKHASPGAHQGIHQTLQITEYLSSSLRLRSFPGARRDTHRTLQIPEYL